MEHDNEFEVLPSAEVIASLAAAPMPSRGLEERVVRSLRDRGILRHPRRGLGMAGIWLGALAASLAFFVGVGVGRSRAESEVRIVGGQMTPVDSANVSAFVRATAYNYVTALVQVDGGHPDARAAAIDSFRNVLDQVVRLAPESRVAVGIRWASPLTYSYTPVSVAGAQTSSSLIWF